MARALVLEPQVLLFDEPLSNLRREIAQARAMRTFARLQQRLNLTVAYSHADQREALAVSDHIIVYVKRHASPRWARRGSFYEAPRRSLRCGLHRRCQSIDVEVRPIDEDLAEVRVGSSVLTLPRRGLVGRAGENCRATGVVHPVGGRQRFQARRHNRQVGLSRLAHGVHGGSCRLNRFAIDRNVLTPFSAGAVVHGRLPMHGVNLVPHTARDQDFQRNVSEAIRGSA